MKTKISLLLIAAVSIISACKKNDPAPAFSTPSVNQSSTTAPSLNAGANTNLSVYTGSDNAGFLNLVAVVSDPQGDDWSITSVTSSNIAVVTVRVAGEGSGIAYTGISAGTTTFTIIATDVSGNTNTFTYSITVSEIPAAPQLNAGTNTTLYVQEGSVSSWSLYGKVTDYQGDEWDVTAVISSNTSVATVSIDDYAYIKYTGQTEGTVTMTVTLADEHNNTSTFTATVHVTPKPSKPIDIVIEK